MKNSFLPEVALGKSTYQFIDRDCQEFRPNTNWPRCWPWVVIQLNDWIRSEMKAYGWSLGEESESST